MSELQERVLHFGNILSRCPKVSNACELHFEDVSDNRERESDVLHSAAREPPRARAPLVDAILAKEYVTSMRFLSNRILGIQKILRVQKNIKHLKS